ncbi:MAG: hypothetical protein GY781_21080 [Gammaproteobacteria bacterium]|nr:hypothetical protein [Gammaproteobacteria bacterium]
MKMIKVLTAGLILLAGLPCLADDVTYTISPRVWKFYDDMSFPGGFAVGPSGNPFISSQEPFDVTLYGASLSFRMAETLPNTTFTLTALNGSDSENRSNLGGNVIELDNGTRVVFTETYHDQDLDRTDIEFTAQTQINDLSSWVVGLRYERSRLTLNTTSRYAVANTPEEYQEQTNLNGTVRIVSPEPYVGNGGYDLYTLRAGVAGTFPINSSGSQRFYANGLLFLGRQLEIDNNDSQLFEDRTLVGPDISVGYLVSLGDSISFDVRYRALFYYPLSGDSDGDSPDSTHGVNLGINVVF